MVRFKDSVRFRVWTPAISTILDVLTEVHDMRYSWLPEDLFITSVNDGEHMTNSRHYTNEAIDVRSKNFQTSVDKLSFMITMRERLGSKFTVLYENAGKPNEHFHIQVKKGEIYP